MSDFVELTLAWLKKTGFKSLYKKLLLGEELSDIEKIKILSIAIVLTNQGDNYLKQLGYRIVLIYGNNTKDYEPLFDISINNGLIPVSSNIRQNFEKAETSFFSEFIDCYSQIYKSGNISYTEQQYLLNQFFKERHHSDVSVVAPTSYGKSELIISLLRAEEANVCIIVPTKSLLGQIKKRILDANIDWVKKVITHPDMYNPDIKNSVFVLTQERLSRLMQKHKNISFEIAVIDEAHNLLGDDERNTLLASVLHILKSRNVDTSFKFLTPFLIDHTNLKLRYKNTDLSNYKVTECVKSEMLFLSDFRNDQAQHLLYDQFINEFIELEEESSSSINFILQKQQKKNLIYFNRPKSIEHFCLNFIDELPDVDCKLIRDACYEIEDFTNSRYRIIRCLKKGVIYHHGSIPDLIKPYLEHIYTKSNKVRFLVSSSTLLEGVNLPIECLFIMQPQRYNRKLTASQLKNLIGRIARFNQIFNMKGTENFQLLQPSVFLIGTEEYSRKNANLRKFIQERLKVDIKVQDDIQNPLLSNTIIDSKKDDLQKAESRLENLENGILEDYQGEYAKTDVGRFLYAHNVYEFDIFQFESEIEIKLKNHKIEEGYIDNAKDIMKVITDCFIPYISEDSLSRLKNDAAKNFYSMFLDWKVKNYSFKKMIARVVKHWQQLNPADKENVFVGRRWGDKKYLNSYYESWTNLQNKSDEQKINLAIVRVKEEEDFFENSILKFVEVLNDYELVEENFYLKIKYGTTDKQKIRLIHEGFSKVLANLLVTEYSKYIYFDKLGNLVINQDLVPLMKSNEEKAMLVFEAESNIATSG